MRYLRCDWATLLALPCSVVYEAIAMINAEGHQDEEGMEDW